MKAIILKIGINVAILAMRLPYFFFKLLPTKNRIVFLSRQSDNCPVSFRLVIEEIARQNWEVKTKVLAKKIDKSPLKTLLYGFHIIVQQYYIATSKVAVLDSYNISISVLKHKKTLKVIQMWHALGSYKKFALSILDKDEGRSQLVAQTMKMHQNYDFILTSSKSALPNFAEAFGYPHEKMVILPIPYIDELLDKQKVDSNNKKILQRYPQMAEKKNILYVPTFRKDSIREKEAIMALVDAVAYDKYNLIIKLHPVSNLTINDDRVISAKEFSSQDMIALADYVITDYSAIIYELALLKKAIFLYTYDFNEYIDKRDFYFDYNDLPAKRYEDVRELLKDIDNDNYDSAKINSFAKQSIELPENATCAQAFVTLLKSLVV